MRLLRYLHDIYKTVAIILCLFLIVTFTIRIFLDEGIVLVFDLKTYIGFCVFSLFLINDKFWSVSILLGNIYSFFSMRVIYYVYWPIDKEVSVVLWSLDLICIVLIPITISVGVCWHLCELAMLIKKEGKS